MAQREQQQIQQGVEFHKLMLWPPRALTYWLDSCAQILIQKTEDLMVAFEMCGTSQMRFDVVWHHVALYKLVKPSRLCPSHPNVDLAEENSSIHPRAINR